MNQRANSYSIPAWRISAFLTVVLGAAALAPLGTFRMLLFAAAPGLVAALGLRRRWRALEYPVAGVALSLALWAAAAPLLWKGGSALSAWWTPALALLWTVGEWRHNRRVVFHATKADVSAAAFMALMAVPIVAVFWANGMATGDGQPVYRAREWFAWDGFYLFSLVQSAIESQGAPIENPFLAGAPNCYPSLIHCGLAQLTLQSGQIAALAVPKTHLLFSLATMGLLVFAPMRRAGMQTLGWRSFASFAGAAGVALLRPDLFIYPQTNSFAFSFLLLIVWLLGPRPPRTPAVPLAAALALALALVFSHTLTSIAALALIAFDALHCLKEKTSRGRGMILMLGLAALAVFFKALNSPPFPSEVDFKPIMIDWLTFFLSISPWIPSLIVIGVAIAGARRRISLCFPSLALALLWGVYYVYGACQADEAGQRFVQFNAERFLHLAALAVLPALLAFRSGSAAFLLAAVAIGAIGHPSALARMTPRLIWAEPLEVSAGDMKLFEEIRLKTPPESRFIVNQDRYALAAFTGRAQTPCQAENLWGRNTIPKGEFRALVSNSRRFWSEASPPERVDFMRQRGLTHALLTGPWAEGVPKLADVRSMFPDGAVDVSAKSGSFIVKRAEKPGAQ
jgi:hypothetical protein